ncbi:hypothetical protein DY000_02034198 [Brassica cretica]|uniref:Uncharacterized protein n=1 Tax=Brassica cretica TaxID=69181 RepID=A0ABQ7DY05_BRACR|nr:hypothetical protein DY000_02034198 [Brassica cretica]
MFLTHDYPRSPVQYSGKAGWNWREVRESFLSFLLSLLRLTPPRRNHSVSAPVTGVVSLPVGHHPSLPRVQPLPFSRFVYPLPPCFIFYVLHRVAAGSDDLNRSLRASSASAEGWRSRGLAGGFAGAASVAAFAVRASSLPPPSSLASSFGCYIRTPLTCWCDDLPFLLPMSSARCSFVVYAASSVAWAVMEPAVPPTLDRKLCFRVSSIATGLNFVSQSR